MNKQHTAGTCISITCIGGKAKPFEQKMGEQQYLAPDKQLC